MTAVAAPHCSGGPACNQGRAACDCATGIAPVRDVEAEHPFLWLAYAAAIAAMVLASWLFPARWFA